MGKEKILNPKNPDDAILILDNLCSQYNGTRQEHFALQQAVNAIRDLIDKNKEKK